MFKLKNKKAFSLSEILMSLAIVGVVAALSVPIISTNTRTKHFEAARKKAIAVAVDAWEVAVANEKITTDNVTTENFNAFAEYFYLPSGYGTWFRDKSGFEWHRDGNTIAVDINTSSEMPNEEGQDIMHFCPQNGTLEVCNAPAAEE